MKNGFKLKPTTPRGLRVLKLHGLLSNDNQEFVNSTTEVYIDPEKLREVCEAVFDEDFSKTDFDEIDLGMVNRGVRDFLLKALGVSQS